MAGRIKGKEERKSRTKSLPQPKSARRKRARPKPIRPDALVIKPIGDTTGAEVLRKIKSDPGLKNLGPCVTKIRRTAGDLLLEIDRSSEKKASEFRPSVETILGVMTEVKILTHEVQMQLKDLDELTTKEEVCEVLRQQLEGAQLFGRTPSDPSGGHMGKRGRQLWTCQRN